MKGLLECVFSFFQKEFRRTPVLRTKICCQGVLTLHILTITLRRNSNPPGIFFSLSPVSLLNVQPYIIKRRIVLLGCLYNVA